VCLPVRIGGVQDVQSGEVLPCDTGVVRRARRDVRSEESPVPALGDTYGWVRKAQLVCVLMYSPGVKETGIGCSPNI
jgi:hypothetical protein